LVEKETLLYINLCRLYPQDFIKYEVIPFNGHKNIIDSNFNYYKLELIKYLTTYKPSAILYFDKQLYETSSCYIKELQLENKTKHERRKCNQPRCGESIAYGQGSGKQIALQFLLDSGPWNGLHRKIILNPNKKTIGNKTDVHPEYKYCTVINIC
jgi:hypothetical protein